MLTPEGPRLLEYNVRFGDPETQSLLPLLETGIDEVCASVASGALRGLAPRFSGRTACGVVIAAPGYPGDYPKGLPVELDGPAAGSDSLLFHASTTRGTGGRPATGGGRCFTAVGIGDDWGAARARAYELASSVRFEGAWYRPDIGDRMHS
jgi:phosphoribosylamine-glycine ligase